MIIDSNLLTILAYQAIENSFNQYELDEFCKEQVLKAIDLWDSNKPNQAIKEIEQAIHFLPDTPFLYLSKALFLSSARKINESKELINSLNSDNFTEFELNMMNYINSCNSFYSSDYYESIWYADEIIRKNKKNHFAYLTRGASYQALNDHKQAIKDFKLALKSKLQIKGIKACIAFSYLKRKKFIRALFLHLTVIKHFKNNFRINHNIGLNYFMLNLFSKSLKHINKSIELKPDFADAYKSRALIYISQGDPEKAKIELEIAQKLGAKNIDKTLKRFNL